MSYAPGLYFVRDVGSPPYQLTTVDENGSIQTKDLKRFEIQGVKYHLSNFSQAFHKEDINYFYKLLNIFSSAPRNKRTKEHEADKLLSSYVTPEDQFLGTFLRSLTFGPFVRVISYINKEELDAFGSDLEKFGDACQSAFNNLKTDRNLRRKARKNIEEKLKADAALKPPRLIRPLQFGPHQIDQTAILECHDSSPSAPHQLDRTATLECYDSSLPESTLSLSLKRREPPAGNQQTSAHKKPKRDERLQVNVPLKPRYHKASPPLDLPLPLHVHPRSRNELPQYQIGKGDQETNLQILHAPHVVSLQARQELPLPSLQQNKKGMPSARAQSIDSYTFIPLNGLNVPGEIRFGYRTIPSDDKIALFGIFSAAIKDGFSRNEMDFIFATAPEAPARNISITIRVTAKDGYWILNQLGLQHLVTRVEDPVIMYTNAMIDNLGKLGDTLYAGIQSSPLRKFGGESQRTICIQAFARKFPPFAIEFTIEMGRPAGYTVLNKIGMEVFTF
ncbi:hypothetical protein G7Y89_g936 [Cudoniella acicularis]|uniref:Uncharacterized protein n=1 Tax=Cudoniella acicularis TaxID=354080 RepID=A0A8H4W7G9_9HELO|nr:hypothetical protein G7Y89_g936 [Cudoniella acicularis]